MDAITEDATKMVVVIAFDLPKDDNGQRAREILQSVKPLFQGQPNVLVYGAVRETAEAIVTVLNEDITEQEPSEGGG